ncbi:Nek protein kinase, partial [Globisporangium splendens]
MDAYEQVKVIGKGSFGVVTQIVRKADGKALVWKEVNYGQMSEKEKQLIVSEVNILRELRHPHIVRYLDRVIDKQATKIYIVMEYCEGGDLSQYIKRKKREGSYIEEGFIWHIFTHIFLALKECHRHREGNVIRPILHRDIKPGNIFLDSNNNAKLGDFGLAKELSSESRFAQTNVGTPYYMSPEMVNEMTYDERSDIWALGCLLYEMATLAPPFDATNQLALAKKINAGKFTRIPQQYSEGLFQVIRWMLHRQRSRRPRIEDLERVPQLQQRLRAYAAANAPSPEQQLQATYSQKMKELLAIEEDLRRQEAALIAREKKLKGVYTSVSFVILVLIACQPLTFLIVHDTELEMDYVRREAELKKREQIADMMSRKMPYNPTKVSSPTTSDGSNSSADNNYNNSGPSSPRRKTPEFGNNSGSPGRSGRGMHSLAEYHQDFQLKMTQQQQSAEEPSPASGSRPRVFLHSNSDSALSRSGGYAKPGSASPGYYPAAEPGSLPSGSLPRQRDTPEQVVSIMKGLWKKN